MNNKDTHLIWEAYDERLDNPHHQREVRKLKRENPHLPEMRRKAKEEMAAERERKQQGDKDERGVHGDRPDAGESLSDYDLEVVESRENDDDRYWETWEIRATSRAAADQFGHGPIDWIYQSELPFSKEEIEQKVIRSLHNHGKPRFFKPYSNA